MANKKNLPEKQRYKINIIPCNTANMSKRVITKSKSADDMDNVILNQSDPISAEKKVRDIPEIIPQLSSLATKHMTMIVSRARTVERKQKKIKSRQFLLRLYRHKNRCRVFHL